MNVSEVESIVIDVDTWGQRELLEEICSRYFILGNQSGLSDFSWEINSREGGDISKDIRELNRHLKSLSLIGLLDEGNPPILSVTRYPVDPINVPSWQQSLIWFTMFIFTSLAGCYWISQFENILFFESAIDKSFDINPISEFSILQLEAFRTLSSPALIALSKILLK